MERILLSTYTIRIKDSLNNEQLLGSFNGSNDFYQIVLEYLDVILKNVNEYSSEDDSEGKLHLTLEAMPIADPVERSIYGYFSSGVSGENYKIKDLSTQKSVFNVDRTKHGAFRNVFFYFVLPSGKKTGSLVLQRKSKFGVKTVVAKTLNKFIKGKGFTKYKIEVNNVLHGKVYNKMMDTGVLKKVEFIRKRIPADIEIYYKNNEELETVKGTFKTSMLSASGLPSKFKHFIHKLYSSPNRERIEIPGVSDNFDEIEFELELNGKKKTFYIQKRSKVQPDVDVTTDLAYDNEGIPTSESLVKQAKELINDITNIDVK